MIQPPEEEFDLVLPSNALALGIYDNRPQHFEIDLPRPLLLGGTHWEVGVSDMLYTHNFYEPQEVVVTEADREIGFTSPSTDCRTSLTCNLTS